MPADSGGSDVGPKSVGTTGKEVAVGAGAHRTGSRPCLRQGCFKIAVRGVPSPRFGGPGEDAILLYRRTFWSRVSPARGRVAAATYRGPHRKAANGFLKQPCGDRLTPVSGWLPY